MPSGNYYILYFANSLVGGTLLALLIVWLKKYQGGFSWTSDPIKEFNWHPLLMVLGLVFLYSQSILIYRTGRYNITKKSLKYLHALIHLVAFVCAVVGLQAAFDSHNQVGYKNLYSLHSWIGLVTVIIFAAQFLLGFVTFLYPGVDGSIRKMVMPLHVFFGIAAFVMAIIATVSGLTEMAGYMSDYSDRTTAAYLINFIGVFAVVYGLLTIYLVQHVEYKRVPLPSD